MIAESWHVRARAPSTDPGAPGGRWRRFGLLLAIDLAFIYLIMIGSVPYFPWLRAINLALATVCSGVFLGYLVRRRAGLPRTPLDLGIVALLAAALLATVAGLDARLSLEWLPPLAFFCLLYYALVVALRTAEGLAVALAATRILGVTLLLIGGLEIAGWYAGAGPIGPPDGWVAANGEWTWPPFLTRNRLPFANPGSLAALLVLLLPFILSSALDAPRRSARLLLLAEAVLLTLLLVATGSRGALIAWAIAGTCLLILRRVGTGTGAVNRAPLYLAALLPAGLALAAGLLFLAGRQIALDPARLNLFEMAARAFARYPLTGVGPGNFPLFASRAREAATDLMARTTPHNLPLHVGAEAGLAGLLALALLTFGLLRAWWTGRCRARPEGRSILDVAGAALLGLTIHHQVEFFLLEPWFLAALAFLGALIAAPVARPGTPMGQLRRPVSVALAAGFALVLAVQVWQLAAFATFAAGVDAGRAGRFAEAKRAFTAAGALDPAYAATNLQRTLAGQRSETADGGPIGPASQPVAPGAGAVAVAREPAQQPAAPAGDETPESAPSRFTPDNTDGAAARAAAFRQGLDWLGPADAYVARRGLAELAAGDVATARATFRQVLHDTAPALATSVAIGRVAADLNDRDLAREALVATALKRPSLLASTLPAAWGFDPVEIADSATARAGGDPVAEAQLLAFSGRTAGAAGIFTDLAARGSHTGALGLGCLALGRDDPATALVHFEQAAALGPPGLRSDWLPFVEVLRARALAALGERDAALQAYRRAHWLHEAALLPRAALNADYERVLAGLPLPATVPAAPPEPAVDPFLREVLRRFALAPDLRAEAALPPAPPVAWRFLDPVVQARAGHPPLPPRRVEWRAEGPDLNLTPLECPAGSD